MFGISFVLAALANPIGNGEASTWIASIISGTITAPIFALAITILYFELAGPAMPDPAAAPRPPASERPPPPTPAG